MSPRTALFLLVLVALLGAAVWWELRREEGGRYATDRPLAEVSLEHVRAVRIDNLERGLELCIELDPDRGWNIVDPIDFPADPARMQSLLDILRTNRATPQARSDLEALQLKPPRAVLELTHQRPGGADKTRIELGALDLDGKHVFCRVDGQVLRTLRNLDTALERDLHDWRNRAVIGMSAQQVVEVHRAGQLQLEGATLDLRFDAASEPGGWRSQAPFRAWVDPLALGALVTTACSLRATGFGQDAPERSDLLPWEQADLSLELIDARGDRVAIEMLRESTHAWLCRRAGSPTVYRVDTGDVLSLAVPSVDLIDLQLMRLVRASVERVRLERGRRALWIQRRAKIWEVGESADGSEPQELRQADDGAVEDLLGELERARLLHLVTEFSAAGGSAGIYVEAGGTLLGGAFGPPHTDPETGQSGVLFQRRGDDVVLLAEERLLELTATPLEGLLDHHLVKLPELAIVAIEIARGETKLSFARDSDTGRWSPAGSEREARELLPVLERLLSLRARRIRPAAERAVASDPIRVVITPGGGLPVSYSIALDAAQGTELFENEDLQAELHRGLHQDLLALLGER